jgi:tetratricopeptide (TPR) repeat protein
MRKWTITLVLVIITIFSFAQSVDDATRFFYREKYKSARDVLQQVLIKNPNNEFAWYWQTRTSIALNDITGAQNLLTRVPDVIKESPVIKVAKGYVLLEQKDSLAARAFFESAIGSSKKKDPSIQLAVAEANVEADKGDINYAIGLLREVAKKDKGNPVPFVVLGDAYRRLQDGSQAFGAYRQALDIDKSFAIAYYKIGKIYQTQDNRDVFLEYYTNALKADPQFAPVYYQLYYYYFNKDINKASQYLDKYITYSDKNIKNDYLLLDMQYISKKFNDAIILGTKIIETERTRTRPRIYKLMAYSYNELDNLAEAETYLKQYFSIEKDSSNYTATDYALMGKILEHHNLFAESAGWYEKAFHLEKEKTRQLDYVVKLADFYKKQNDYTHQSYWLGKLYQLKPNATNLDLFNWGIAEYHAKDYKAADSIFASYETKYPSQTFGYYWRARSNAAIDTALETGIAVPHYEKLIEVASKDTNNATNKKWLIQAYSYIGACKANKDKQYKEALSYYDKVLALDPTNNDAEHYKSVLEKLIGKQNNN